MAAIAQDVFFHMLSYAYRHIQEQLPDGAEALPGPLQVNLAGFFLHKTLARRNLLGLSSGYQEIREARLRLRGKIDLHASLRRGRAPATGLICTFFEWTQNTLANRLVAMALRLLIAHSALHPDLRAALLPFFSRLRALEPLPQQQTLRLRAATVAPNFRDRPLLTWALFVLQSRAAQPSANNSHAASQKRSAQAMGSLFEAFLYAFLQDQNNLQKACSRPHFANVERCNFPAWIKPISPTTAKKVPTLTADIVLHGKLPALVVEAKYYRKIFSPRRPYGAARKGSRKFRSNHIYQLLGYMQAAAEKLSDGKQAVRGFLIYAGSLPGQPFCYRWGAHTVSIWAVDLSQSWTTVRQHLHQIFAVATQHQFCQQQSTNEGQ